MENAPEARENAEQALEHSETPTTTPQAATEELMQRNEALPANAIRHAACGNWWTGISRAHCPACHRTFSSDSAANKHRVGKYGVDRRCVDPATVGLVATQKPYGLLWSHPAPEGGYAALHTPAAVCPVAAENTQAVTR